MLVYYLAYLSYTKFLSNDLPFVLTSSVFFYEFFLCIVSILSINYAFWIIYIGSYSPGFNFLSGFNKNLNIYVIFYPTKGIDHENKSIKFGKKYGCGFSKNCWISRVLF